MVKSLIHKLSLVFLSLFLTILSPFLFSESFDTLPSSLKSLSINLDQAVELAMRYNINLQNSELDLNSKRFARDSFWNPYLPKSNASLGLKRASSNINTSSEEDHWAMVPSVEFSLAVNPSSITQMYKAFLDYDSQKISYEKLKQQIRKEVGKLFYQLLAKKKGLSIIEIEIQNAEARYEQAKANYNSGLSNDLSVLQAQVALETTKPSLESSQIEYESLLINFKTLLGINLETYVNLLGDIEVEYLNLDEKSIVETASQSIEVKEKLLGIKTIENANMNQFYGLFPTLSVSFNWSPMNKSGTPIRPFKDGAFDNLDWGSNSITLALSWGLDSLLPWSSYGVNKYQSDQELKKARNNYSYSLRNFISDIKLNIKRLQSYTSVISARESSLSLAQTSYKRMQEAYRSGLEELLKVQDAAIKVRQAELDLLNAKLQYVNTIIDLEYALNIKDIKDFSLDNVKNVTP